MNTPASEAELIRRFRSFFPEAGKYVRRWGGEDAARIASHGGETVACVDLLVEDVHFRLDWGAPEALGYKSVAVNYSDLAACGAEPAYIMLGLAAPPAFLRDRMDGFYAGIRRALDSWGGEFAGGDYTRADKVFISLSAVGVLEADMAFWTRAGARPGDHLYLTGTPGRAALALQRLLAGEKDGVAAQLAPDPPLAASRRLAVDKQSGLDAQLAPDPPLAATRWLRKNAVPVGGCCDTSDGLSTSLHLLAAESGCRLVLDTAALPLPAGPDSLPLALGGGEDYDLLFTTPALLDSGRCRRESGIRLTRIGCCTDGSGVTDNAGRSLPDSGYDHLR